MLPWYRSCTNLYWCPYLRCSQGSCWCWTRHPPLSQGEILTKIKYSSMAFYIIELSIGCITSVILRFEIFLAIPRILRRKPWCFCPQKAHHGRTCCRIHGLSWGRKRRSLQTSVQPIHQGNKVIPAIYLASTSATKISFWNVFQAFPYWPRSGRNRFWVPWGVIQKSSRRHPCRPRPKS